MISLIVINSYNYIHLSLSLYIYIYIYITSLLPESIRAEAGGGREGASLVGLHRGLEGLPSEGRGGVVVMIVMVVMVVIVIVTVTVTVIVIVIVIHTYVRTYVHACMHAYIHDIIVIHTLMCVQDKP